MKTYLLVFVLSLGSLMYFWGDLNSPIQTSPERSLLESDLISSEGNKDGLVKMRPSISQLALDRVSSDSSETGTLGSLNIDQDSEKDDPVADWKLSLLPGVEFEEFEEDQVIEDGLEVASSIDELLEIASEEELVLEENEALLFNSIQEIAVLNSYSENEISNLIKFVDELVVDEERKVNLLLSIHEQLPFDGPTSQNVVSEFLISNYSLTAEEKDYLRSTEELYEN